MSVPHLDRRVILMVKKRCLFGPYAGFLQNF